MKKAITLFTFLLLMDVIKAQESKLIGSWLMTKAEVGDEIETPYFVSEFQEDGKLVLMGIEFGTWEYNKASHAIIMHSEIDKDFNGEGKILSLTKKELVIEKDGAKLFYRKVDMAEISAKNKKSGLIGTWEFNDVPYPGAKTLITFTEPDEYTMIEKAENSSSRGLGTWIFDKKDMSLILIGMNGGNVFEGKSKVIKISDEAIELENNRKVLKGVIKAKNTTKIERLTFTEDEFYTVDGDYNYYGNEEKLPWRNRDEMKLNLLNVKQLVYNYSTLIHGTEIFENKILIADVHASLAEEGFNVDNIFNGYDRYNLPEDVAFPQNAEYYNPLYPLGDIIFRIRGNEEITTPAGIFDCVVLEAIAESGDKLKLWMIADKMGIYAKIIQDDPDETFGHYVVYELQEIVKGL